MYEANPDEFVKKGEPLVDIRTLPLNGIRLPMRPTATTEFELQAMLAHLGVQCWRIKRSPIEAVRGGDDSAKRFLRRIKLVLPATTSFIVAMDPYGTFVHDPALPLYENCSWPPSVIMK